MAQSRALRGATEWQTHAMEGSGSLNTMCWGAGGEPGTPTLDCYISKTYTSVVLSQRFPKFSGHGALSVSVFFSRDPNTKEISTGSFAKLLEPKNSVTIYVMIT